jgi:hypothetical protein
MQPGEIFPIQPFAATQGFFHDGANLNRGAQLSELAEFREAQTGP